MRKTNICMKILCSYIKIVISNVSAVKTDFSLGGFRLAGTEDFEMGALVESGWQEAHAVLIMKNTGFASLAKMALL